LSKVFPKWVNQAPLAMLVAVPGGLLGSICFVWYFFSPWFTDVGYAPLQPVPFSHKLHAGDLGLDCLYCHSSVDRSPHANIPSAQTCMNCHHSAGVKPDSEKLKLVRESFVKGDPLPWVRVHQLPDYVQFDHGVHLNAGVGCVSCHGRVDQMEVVRQSEPLSMSWCLDCHRDPAKHLRPPGKITDMDYESSHPDEGALLAQHNNIKPPENCSACHY
jgi:hypothetical protein